MTDTQNSIKNHCFKFCYSNQNTSKSSTLYALVSKILSECISRIWTITKNPLWFSLSLQNLDKIHSHEQIISVAVQRRCEWGEIDTAWQSHMGNLERRQICQEKVQKRWSFRRHRLRMTSSQLSQRNKEFRGKDILPTKKIGHLWWWDGKVTSRVQRPICRRRGTGMLTKL